MSRLEFVVVAQQGTTELELVLMEFLLAKEGAGLAGGTLQKYRHMLDRLLLFLAARAVASPADLDGLSERAARLLVREWVVDLQRRNFAASTISGYVMAAKSFLNWCREEGILKRALGPALKAPPDRPKILRTVFREDFEALLAACDDTAAGLRNAALVSLLYDTGLRASEAARLRTQDVQIGFEWEGDTLHFVSVQVKGGRDEIGVFGDATCARLRAWLAARTARPGEDSVFISLSGKRPYTALTRYGVADILRELSRRAKIEHVTPHAFRRGFAVRMEELGYSSKTGTVLGRWKSMSSYERYTKSITALRTALHISTFPADNK